MNPCLENIILFTESATKYEANMTELSVHALLYLDQLTYNGNIQVQSWST